MFKFCTQCGRPLQEGEICSCQLNAENAEKQPGQDQAYAGQSSQRPSNTGKSDSGQPYDSQVNGGQAYPGEPSSSQAYGSQAYPGQAYGGQPGAGQAYDGQFEFGAGNPNPGQAYGGQSSAGQAYDGQFEFGAGQAYPGQAYDGQSGAGQAFDGQPYDGQYNTGQPFPGQPYQGQFSQGQPSRGQQAGAQAAAYAQDFFKMVLGALKSPVLAGRDMVMKADLKVSLLLIFLEGLFSALFVTAIALSGIAKLKASMGSWSSYAPDISVPFFRILIFFVFFAFLNALVFAGIMLVGHLAIKVSVSFGQMLSLSGVKSMSLLPGILAAMVLCVLNIYVGMVVYALALYWGNIVAIVTMTSLAPQDKLNKFAAMLCIGLMVSLVVSLFIMGAMGASFIPDVLDMPF